MREVDTTRQRYARILRKMGFGEDERRRIDEFETVTGNARMTAEIEQIKTDPRAYFAALPRPPRLRRTS